MSCIAPSAAAPCMHTSCGVKLSFRSLPPGDFEALSARLAGGGQIWAWFSVWIMDGEGGKGKREGWPGSRDGGGAGRASCPPPPAPSPPAPFLLSPVARGDNGERRKGRQDLWDGERGQGGEGAQWKAKLSAWLASLPPSLASCASAKPRQIGKQTPRVESYGSQPARACPYLPMASLLLRLPHLRTSFVYSIAPIYARNLAPSPDKKAQHVTQESLSMVPARSSWMR